MQSLDPRVVRLQLPESFLSPYKADKLDQFPTFEVFIKQKENKAFEHAGVIHAPNQELAFLFAKEQYSRRFTCAGLGVVKTQNIILTPYTENGINLYDLLVEQNDLEKLSTPAVSEDFEIYHLYKRGKQHTHEFSVKAANYEHAVLKAKQFYDHSKPVLNIWIIKRSDFLFSSDEDKDIWDTLGEKKHREVIAYRAQDKLNKFKEKRSAIKG